MKQVIFTLNEYTPNVRETVKNQSGKKFKSVQEFIDQMEQYDLAQDEDIIIYETIQEFTEAHNNNDTKSEYMGYFFVSTPRKK